MLFSEDSQRAFCSCSLEKERFIHDLYFCVHCVQVKCIDCAAHEIANHYCPNCLFEVPSTSAVENDESRCTRNCFECPRCYGPLMLNDLSSSASATADPSTLHLKCFNCNWSSLDSDVIKFQRSTGLSGQLQKRLAERDLHSQSMDKIKKYWKSVAAMSTNSSSTSAGSNSSSILRKFNNDAKLIEEQSNLVKEIYSDFEIDACANNPGLPDYINSPNRQLVWTSKESSSHGSCEVPKRTHLKSRMNVRCNKCKHLLIKPSTKPATLEFTISQFAYTYCPSLACIPTKDPKIIDLILTSSVDMSTQNLSAFIPVSENDCTDELTKKAHLILRQQNIELASFTLEQQKLFVDADAAEHNELVYTVKLKERPSGRLHVPAVISFETLKGAKATILSIVTI